MKQIYLLFLVLFSKNMIQAQPVFPTYEEEPVWTVAQSHIRDHYPVVSYQVQILSDTTICDNVYFKVEADHYPPSFTKAILGYYRVEGQKVYFRDVPDCNEPEILLYDFALKPGDTFDWGGAVPARVMSEEYRDYGGVLRRVLEVVYPSSLSFVPDTKRYWVEGVGDLFHPFLSVQCLNDSNCDWVSGITCFKARDSVIIGGYTFDDCNYNFNNPVFPTYEEEPIWCIEYNSIINPTADYYNIFLGSDTTICGITYKKVLANNHPSFEEDKDSIPINFIRSEGKKLYATSGGCNEFLIYDFSLKTGDTIWHNQFNFGVISKEDSINYNGVLRRTLTIDYNQFDSPFPVPPIQRTWVEGIGDLFHPFSSQFCVDPNCEYSSKIVCFSNKNGIQYGACTEPCNVDNDTITMQPVFPTYEEEPVWCVEVSNSLPPYEKFYSSLEMLPDTMICGKLYYPLASRKLSSTGNRDTTISITGYVREEGKRVYQLLSNCEEIILCDFSLSVGDSLVYNYANQELKAIVNKISFQEFNGISRRVFEVIYGSNVAFEVRFWIEGLGDRFYPLLQIECFTGAACDGSTIARCLSTKNGIQYGACTEPCNIDNTTDTDDIIKNKFVMHLSRNPVRVQEQLNVHLDSTKPATGQLYIVNIFGQILYHKNLQLAGYEERMELDWSPAAAGIYWLVWQNQDGSRQSLKFLVQ